MTRAAEDRVPEAVVEAIDPTAPGATAAPVDLPAVAPATAPVRSGSRVVGAAGVLGVAVLVVLAIRTGGSAWPVDRTVHAWIVEHRGSPDAAVARAVTWGGATTVTLPALLVVGALLPRGRRGWRDRLGSGLLLAGTAALGVWLGLAVNHAVGRERPPVADWWGAAGGPSFPSGHTTAATIAAGTLAWALLSRARTRGARWAVWCVAIGYAAVVGWSRAWLGVHWPSDVLAGWLVGATWVALVVTAVAVAERLRRRRPPATAQVAPS